MRRGELGKRRLKALGLSLGVAERRPMNVLILSASAKAPLVTAFRAAATERGGRVIACDIAADSPALYLADEAVLVPRSDDPTFAGALIDLCATRDVRLVVPTRDGELVAVAAAAERLRAMGVAVLVPSPAALAVCRDKQAFTEFCASLGLATARTYAPGEIPQRFPVFMRPVVGAGGAGARRLDTAEEVEALGDAAEGFLVQDHVDDPEYTVDVLMDLAGRPLQAIVRSRLVVRGGESQKSRVEDVPALAEGALRLCAALRLVGHNVVQAFHSPAAGARFIEINPRFGGASALGIEAGLDSPRRILSLVAGETEAAAQPRPIRYGLTLLRHSADVFVDRAAIDALAARR
jgi:carbamoyl-phosphate synthase large subunit